MLSIVSLCGIVIGLCLLIFAQRSLSTNLRMCLKPVSGVASAETRKTENSDKAVNYKIYIDNKLKGRKK